MCSASSAADSSALPCPAHPHCRLWSWLATHWTLIWPPAHVSQHGSFLPSATLPWTPCLCLSRTSSRAWPRG